MISTCLFLMEVWITEGHRVNFVMREALFEIYTWILCLSYLHEKQTSIIQSLYLYFIKIVQFWLRNIRFFLIQNIRPLFYGGHYSSLHRLMSLHGKKDVKIFHMFIVAEYTGSVNSMGTIRIFPVWYNINIYRVLTKKMVWKYLNCGLFLEKIYLRLNENGCEISFKMVY